MVDISELKVSCESELGVASIRKEEGEAFVDCTCYPKCFAQDKQQRIELLATLRNGEQLRPIFIPVRTTEKSAIMIEPANLFIRGENDAAAECVMGVVHLHDSMNRDIDDIEVISSSGLIDLYPKKVNVKQWLREVKVDSKELPIADEIGIRARTRNASCEASFTIMAHGS